MKDWKIIKLARLASERLFVGPEPTCSISVDVAKKAVRDCKK
jgi:hypothetical protein